MKIKSQIIHLSIMINNEEFFLGTLKFNSKGEIFWFSHNSCYFDHISFHPDCVHIVIKNEREKDRYFYPIKKDLLPSHNQIQCIFIEEFCMNGFNNHCIIPGKKFTPWNDQKTQISLKLDKPIATFDEFTDFTMIIMFVPKEYTKDSLNSFVELCSIRCKEKEIKFSNFLTSNASVLQKSYSESGDILIFIVPKTRNVFKYKGLPLGPLRISNYNNPLESICEIL